MVNSILQPDGEKVCFLTGSRVDLDKHHIFHGCRRKAADKWGCWVWLNHHVHMNIHDSDKETDRELQRTCQRKFEFLYGHEKFMQVFGKSYL